MRIINLSIAAAVAITALGCESKSTRGARSPSVVARGPPVKPEAESERAILPENAEVITSFINELFSGESESFGSSLLSLEPIKEALGDMGDDEELIGALGNTLAAIRMEQVRAAIVVALQPGRGVLPKVAAQVEKVFANIVQENLAPGDSRKLLSKEEAKSFTECSTRVSLALSEIEKAENPSVPKIFDMLVQLLESNEVKDVTEIVTAKDDFKRLPFLAMRANLRGGLRAILRVANIVDIEGLKAALDKGAAELVKTRPQNKDTIKAVMTAFKTYINERGPGGAGDLVFFTGFPGFW